MPKPEGYSSAKWAVIERNVRRGCSKLARKNGWNQERTDQCVYGRLNNISQYIKARNERKRNVKSDTGATP